MKKGRRNHRGSFKVKLAWKAIRGLKSTAELASEFEVHPSQIVKWKKQVLGELPGGFSGRRVRPHRTALPCGIPR